MCRIHGSRLERIEIYEKNRTVYRWTEVVADSWTEAVADRWTEVTRLFRGLRFLQFSAIKIIFGLFSDNSLQRSFKEEQSSKALQYYHKKVCNPSSNPYKKI